MIDLPTFMCALAMVETGGNDLAIGKNGERSRYQITERVWRKWRPTRPFSQCRDVAATCVASEHLVWGIRIELPLYKRDNPIWLAVAWHSGLARSKTGKFRSLKHAEEALGYAIRVKNIYNDLQKEQRKAR